MPKKIDKEQKKAKILEAAIRVFAKKGLVSTKMADIAEAADIGKGTIYEYFRSKDEILEASFQHFLDGVDYIFTTKITRISDPLEKLIAYILAWADVLDSDHMDYVEIILDFWTEGIRTKRKFAAIDLPRYYEKSRLMLQDLLDDCVKKKKIGAADSRIVASIILGSLDGLIVQWVIDRQVFDMRKAVETLAKVITEGLK